MSDLYLNLLDTIDRNSYEPVYVQLANLLHKQISLGKFKIGDQLPSESQLCQKYEVSPMTVRRSINLLADQGIVSTAQGRGTFVKPMELSEATFDLRSLQEHFTDVETTDVKILDARVVSANERTAHKLGIKVGQNTIFIRRLITKYSKPIFYHRAYLIYDPLRPIVEAEMDVTSLQGLFAATENRMLQRGELDITATMLNAEEAVILHAIIPSPAFNLEHLFFDMNNRPVSWGWLICRSDYLRFSATVGIKLTGK